MAKKTVDAPKTVSKGTCTFCKSEIEKSKMTQHLKHCKQRLAVYKEQDQQAENKIQWYHLVVEGKYLPMYWMHLEVPTDATLGDLDDFLRGIWLECCDHLSEFRIGKTSYTSQAEEMFWNFEAPSVQLNPSGVVEAQVVTPGSTDGVKEVEEEEEEEALSEEEMMDSVMEMTASLLDYLHAEFPQGLGQVPTSAIEEKIVGLLRQEPGANAAVLETPEFRTQISSLAQMAQLGMLDMLVQTFDEDPGERGMDVELAEALKVGDKFTHTYDFGSSTELALRVVAERTGADLPEDAEEVVQIMARNEAPELLCRECGKPAVKIEAGYIDGAYGALCEKHAKKADEGMLLPIVNSPRTGVCGYTGNVEWAGDDEDWEEEEWDEDEDEE